MQSFTKKVVFLSLLAILAVFMILSYLLSFYITLYGSAFLFLFTTISLFRFIINLLVFPGSYRFWLKMIESHYSQELSTQSITKFNQLIRYLSFLKDQSQDPGLSDKSIKVFQRFLTNIIGNFTYLQAESIITKDQSSLLAKLNNLKSLLSNTSLVLLNDTCISIWDFIESPDLIGPQTSTAEIDTCIEACSEIVSLIQSKLNRSFLRGGFVLGTGEYMRADLFKRFSCEQFWIQGDGALLDCIWISGIISFDTSPVIIFCNPNAAYYEFSFFQTDWIELYVGSGVNLVLWNYRGYGRSTGRPDINKMKEDAEKIAQFIKQKKNVKTVGVHGESLGGTIAAHLANKEKVDFLFADRTFQSLSATVKHSYGTAAEVLFKVFGPKDSDSVTNFIESKCFKIVSCDCNDLMINNLGSLKAGVAEYYFSRNPERFVFTDPEISELLSAIQNIQSVGNFKKQAERTKKLKRKGSIESGNLLTTLAIYCYEILENMDSGGESFMNLFEDSSEVKIKTWVFVLGIWGSTPEVYSNTNSNNIQSAVEKLTVSSQGLFQLICQYEESSDPGLNKFLKNFYTVLYFLKKCAQWLNENLPNEGLTGKLLPLTCGHNGSFSSLERFLYEQHLQNAGIF